MKNSLLLLIFVSSFSFAQDLTELDRRNGFKSIQLGSAADSVKGADFKKEIREKNEFAARLYEVDNDEYKSIGEVDVREVQLKAYQGLIYSIVVTTDKDARVMKALEKSFGKGKFIPSSGVYTWGTNLLSLTFRAHKHSIELIYKSHPLISKMYADKGKKVDEIAEGF